MRSNPPSARNGGGGAATPIEPHGQSSSCETVDNGVVHPTASTIGNDSTRPFNSTFPRLFVGEQGKRARFYRNGDQFFKGFWYTISAFRSWNSLLEDLNHHVGDSITLPLGVRVIFTVDGQPRQTLEELEHGMSYVCSSTDKFKSIDYANASQPMWSFVSSQRPAPLTGGTIRARFEKEPNDFVRPRIITIIRNGLKPRRVVRHLLNKRTAQSFEHVMQDITAIVKLNSGVVRKLHALNGKQVTCLADFFLDDYVFVAYGPEKVSVDDFDVISEEYKRMNMRGGADGAKTQRCSAAGRCEMPVRNDGFRRTMSPDPKSKMAQAMRLPAELAERIRIVQLIGDGNTALVFKALFRNDGGCSMPSLSGDDATPLSSRSASPDALKVISKENAEENLDFVETEIKLLSEVRHAFIVAMKEYHVVDNSWYIRMELMEEGDLFEYLAKKRSLNESDAASCTDCLCQALDYLHNNNIVHRDVKPENLLIYQCRETGLLKLKLADFGLASKVRDGELLYDLCGTPTYVAPEVLAQFGYSYKADCWSAGVILYILLCGFPPFGMDADQILFNKIVRGIFDFPSPSFDNVSFAAKLLIRRLLSTEPETRLSARDVTDYFWVKTPGVTNAELEETCMIDLDEAMTSFSSHSELEESDSEFFYSRRASADEFSARPTANDNVDDVDGKETFSVASGDNCGSIGRRGLLGLQTQQNGVQPVQSAAKAAGQDEKGPGRLVDLDNSMNSSSYRTANDLSTSQIDFDSTSSFTNGV